MGATYEYKCPCCGGALSFDAETQNVKCPYCDTEFETESLKECDEGWQEEQVEWKSGGTEWSEEEKERLSVYLCEACGGELVSEETTASSFCPYCGNPVIFKGRLAGGLKPDYIIPFKFEKEKVNERFSAFVKGKILLPRAFRHECKTEEIKGLYVPFWIYDADVTGRVQYRATKTRYWSDGNYDYTEVRHYSVLRGGEIGFDHIPVDGSKKMDDTLMESIEPYRFSDAVAFQSAFLSGFYTDKYDVSQEETFPRANERIRQGTEDALRDTVQGYDSVTTEKSSVRLNRSEVNYTLYPVWMMQKSWRDKTYTYAINGQTGKVAGDLPMSVGRLILFTLLIALIGALIGFGVAYLAEGMEVVVVASVVGALIAGGLAALFLVKQIKTVVPQRGASSYYRDGSLHISEQRDTFLYRNVTRTKRQTSKDDK